MANLQFFVWSNNGPFFKLGARARIDLERSLSTLRVLAGGLQANRKLTVESKALALIERGKRRGAGQIADSVLVTINAF